MIVCYVAPGIKGTFKKVICAFVFTFHYVSYYAEEPNLHSKVVFHANLYFPVSPSLPVWEVSSVRAGPHYSLLSLLALRLQSLVLHFPVPDSLSCSGPEPYLSNTQSSRGSVLLSTRSTLFPIASFPRGAGRTLCTLAPAIRTKTQHEVQIPETVRVRASASSIHAAWCFCSFTLLQ